MKTRDGAFWILFLGKVAITVATLTYGVVPLLVDLTETHALHPAWSPHARFHLVWQILSGAGVALIALSLLWLYSGSMRLRANVATALGLALLGGFYASMLLRPVYGSALNEPGGVPLDNGMDQNLRGFSVALIILVVGWILCHVATRSGKTPNNALRATHEDARA
jgi:hypothetical protein